MKHKIKTCPIFYSYYKKWMFGLILSTFRETKFQQQQGLLQIRNDENQQVNMFLHKRGSLSNHNIKTLFFVLGTITNASAILIQIWISVSQGHNKFLAWSVNLVTGIEKMYRDTISFVSIPQYTEIPVLLRNSKKSNFFL